MHPVTGGTRTGGRGVAHCVVPLLPSPHQLGARAPVTDGPLIVQSDKTLLLEVDHPAAADVPGGDRPVRRAGALPRARAHLPADPARAVERPRRRARRRAGRRRAGPLLPLPGAARAAGRRRRHHGPLRPAPAGQPPGARAGAGQPGPRGAGGGRPAEEGRPDARRPHRPGHRRRCTRPSAAGSSRRCSRSAGRPRTSPATSTARRTRSSCAQDGWDAARLPAGGRARASGPAAPASSCCPAAPARRWSARPRWPRPTATTLILVTNTVAGRQWKRELLARTSLTEEEIGEYSGERKEIRPVTIATYQVMTHPPEGRVPAPGAVRQPATGA